MESDITSVPSVECQFTSIVTQELILKMIPVTQNMIN